MDDNKVYIPEVVAEIPFPGEVPQSVSAPQSGTASNPTPTVTPNNVFPTKRTAVELLSIALNTRSRKILQQFELQQSGGLQIGNFEEGITGDVSITPNGIVGRNNSGDTTFGLDTDGNLILIGQLRAGSTIVADTIVTEEASNGNGRTVYYNDGLAAIIIGDPS